MQTMQFQRAARTDKGVSALRQIVSLLLREFYKKLTIKNIINSNLLCFIWCI